MKNVAPLIFALAIFFAMALVPTPAVAAPASAPTADTIVVTCTDNAYRGCHAVRQDLQLKIYVGGKYVGRIPMPFLEFTSHTFGRIKVLVHVKKLNSLEGRTCSIYTVGGRAYRCWLTHWGNQMYRVAVGEKVYVFNTYLRQGSNTVYERSNKYTVIIR